jgi:phycoerythrin-associated linker protein
MAQIFTQAVNPGLDINHAEAIIRAANRQVFGNAHLMENERVTSAESMYCNGSLTVQGLITALALSDTYRRLFLDANGPYRFVELNFKHLLGRAPRNQAEISEHVQRLANEGYEAEVTSYTNSQEFFSAFGTDTVPHCRTNQTTLGESNSTYLRTLNLDSGVASFDGASKAKLLASLATGSTPSLNERKPKGGSDRNLRSYQIVWSSAGVAKNLRRSIQKSIVPYSSLSSTIQSLQARGCKIQSINNI